MDIAVVPMGTDEDSLSPAVAACVSIIRASGLAYELHAMGTQVEGPLTELLGLVERLHEAMRERGADRVYSVLKIDDRYDKPLTMQGKVAAVEARL
jgi:uncharacterized protein (TIGR00106 family)